MKTIKLMSSMLAMAWLICLSSCSGPDCIPSGVRIKSFTWDGVSYQARYGANGRLTKLQASTRDIVFLYDENGKLYKTSIRNSGEAVPLRTYEYKHSTTGISEILISDRNDFDNKLHPIVIHKIYYQTPTRLTAIVEQYLEEQGDSVILSTRYYRRFTYEGSNIALIDMIPPFTEYRGLQYDNKVNPFMMLANAVGNPAFFPAGLYANFPVVNFDIPFVSVFSQNNPLAAQYITIDGAFPSNQTFTNIYNNNLVKKIVWVSRQFPPPYIPDFRTFLFEYERAPVH